MTSVDNVAKKEAAILSHLGGLAVTLLRINFMKMRLNNKNACWS